MYKRIKVMWKHFIQALPLMLAAMLLTAISVLAATGTTDAPAAPGSTGSYTLEDIYQRLANGTAGTQGYFSEPVVAPGSGSMHDLNDLMAAAPTVDDTDGATAADVSSGATFWGLTSGEWGLQTGSMSSAAGSDVLGPDGALTFNIPDGTYSGNSATAQDSDLTPLNIMKGANIFGVEGKAQSGWSIYHHIGSSYRLRDVEMVSATDGWAGGGNGSYTSYFYHFDGSDWSEHTASGFMGEVVGISMLSAGDGWAVTEDGVVFHYNGAADTWEYHSLINYVMPNEIVMVSATDGWIPTDQGKIYRYNSATDTWFEHTDLGVGELIADLEMVNANEGWLMTRNSEKMYHYDGVSDSWSFYQDINITASAISMVNANDGWLVGLQGEIWHYNSATTDWEWYDLGSDDTDLYDIKMLSANDGWIVGGDGKIYHWNGSSWSLNEDLATAYLSSLSVVNDSDIWAVGNEGYFAHYMK